MRANINYFLFLTGISLLVLNCTKPSSSSKGTNFIPASDSNFVYQGRVDFSTPAAVRFAYTGVSIKFRFEGSTCVVYLKNKSLGKDREGNVFKNYYTVTIDNGKTMDYAVSNEDQKIKIKGLNKGIHEVTIFKRTEALVGEGIFEGIEIEKDKKLLPYTHFTERKMEFIGNSITCGYGNTGDSKDCPFSPETENGYLAYGALTARKLGADYTIVAYSGKGMYRNYDGKTTESMSLVYDRIIPDSVSPKWSFSKWQPDVVVVNLGTNDFAKGIPDSIIFTNTYVNFLKRLRSYYPGAAIFCLDGPMVTDSYPQGAFHLTKLRNYIKASKNKFNDPKIYTFSLSSQQEGDYGCDWHPNLKRHEKMAEELSKYIKTIMRW